MHWNQAVDVPILLAILLLVGAYLYWRLQERLRLTYPPGPPGLPLLGNILDLPGTKQWEAFADWSRKLDSPIVHVKVFGKHIVSVNDLRIARGLFERRGSPHVSRPVSRMITDIQENDYAFAFWPYGESWKTSRRHADAHLRPVAARKLRPLETKVTREVLTKLSDKPAEYVDHLRFLVYTVLVQFCTYLPRLLAVMMIFYLRKPAEAFGVTIQNNDDPIIQIMEKTLSAANESGNYPLVEIHPWVAYLPGWLPGMGWKKKVQAWKDNNRQLKEVPFAAAKQALQDNTAKDSIIAQLLEIQSRDKTLSNNMVKFMPLTLIAAGLGTTVSAFLSVVLLSHVFPATQKAAQAELDSVLGGTRLPTFNDQHHLPFIQAFCKEIIRYTCIVPLCLPHMAIEDDVWNHNGKRYLIPEGATVMPNAWAMTRDPNTYTHPDEFNPWRFLKEDGTLDPGVQDPSMVFGFLPRHCPGKPMAEDMLFIFVASLLAAFKVEPKGKKNMHKADFDSLYKPGIVIHPIEFPCTIVPRNDHWYTVLQAGVSMD